LQDPISKITKAKLDWRHGSSSRATALQVQSPMFKSQSHQKGEEEKKEDKEYERNWSLLTGYFKSHDFKIASFDKTFFRDRNHFFSLSTLTDTVVTSYM
jgi:hypothetical protein